MTRPVAGHTSATTVDGHTPTGPGAGRTPRPAAECTATGSAAVGTP
ncbi:hypothetical protein AB0D35_03030 [Streptomyces sp. NPDC048301]